MNIRIMIVEDEPPIARSLARMIERANEQYLVEAFAVQGAEAVELIRKQPIDIVFTDIRMPVMDGIELLEFLDRDYPEVRKVAVSGYQDFDYVRKAMQFRAVDYLLKPVSEAELSVLLEKLSAEWKESRESRQQRQLSDLLHYRKTIDSSALWCSRFYAAGIVCAGSFPIAPSDILSPASDFWERTDIEGQLRSLLREEEQGWIVQGKSIAEKAVVVGFEDERRAEVLERLFDELRMQETAWITMVGSASVTGINVIGRLYPELRSLLYQSTVLNHSQWMLLEPNAGKSPNRVDTLPDSFNQTIEAIASEWGNRQWERLNRELQEWFAACEAVRLPQTELVQAITAIAVRLQSRLKQTIPLSELDFEIREAVTNARHYDDLRGNLLSVFEHASQDSANPGVPDVVAEVERFLLKHYAEPITGDSLASRFGFVPSYIGKLFRVHRGMSPAQFLIRTRIDRAKELLRQRPDLQIKEISELVGYHDPLYFSRVFQKETGIRPSEYRNPS